LLARLPVKVGDIFYSNQLESVRRAVREFDEHLRITLNSPPTADGGREVTIRIFLPDGQMAPGAQGAGAVPKRIRVGGALQAARLEHSLPPDYPALAKQAGVEGLVLLEAVIGQDGAIENLDVTQGPALLVPAAIAAVKAWRYKPTLLNGEAVEVVTEIAVDFRLP
jgi:TonB family protein